MFPAGRMMRQSPNGASFAPDAVALAAFSPDSSDDAHDIIYFTRVDGTSLARTFINGLPKDVRCTDTVYLTAVAVAPSKMVRRRRVLNGEMSGRFEIRIDTALNGVSVSRNGSRTNQYPSASATSDTVPRVGLEGPFPRSRRIDTGGGEIARASSAALRSALSCASSSPFTIASTDFTRMDSSTKVRRNSRSFEILLKVFPEHPIRSSLESAGITNPVPLRLVVSGIVVDGQRPDAANSLKWRFGSRADCDVLPTGPMYGNPALCNNAGVVVEYDSGVICCVDGCVAGGMNR